MSNIPSFLNEIINLIDTDDFTGASSKLTGFIGLNPDAIDERFRSELSMIEKMMDYKANLKDWSYFRSMKLTYQYLKSAYENKLDPIDETKIGQDLPYKDTIWCCWLQGIDNAPDIVKKCVSSLDRLGRKIIVLSENNYSEYVDIPEYILKKKEEGIITAAHFSDILRAELLSDLGGTWIDATVLCTDSELIGSIFDNYPLFCYSFVMRDSINAYMLFDSWILHCTKKSAIMMDTRNFLHLYWQNESRLLHYFLFHLMFSISCLRHEEEKDRIPIFSLEPCHILQHEMLNKYDEFRYDQIMEMSGIHKLTYKFDTSLKIEGTMLEHILIKNQENI